MANNDDLKILLSKYFSFVFDPNTTFPQNYNEYFFANLKMHFLRLAELKISTKNGTVS